MGQGDFFGCFLDFSVTLTNFTKSELLGTGQAPAYFATLESIIGTELLGELLETFAQVQTKAKDEQMFNRNLRQEIFGSEKLGPIARNIIKLWYVATWYQLPPAWRESFGARERDVTFIVSPQAYPEGLLWRTIGVNPPGAKAPGYGTWEDKPLVTLEKLKS